MLGDQAGARSLEDWATLAVHKIAAIKEARWREWVKARLPGAFPHCTLVHASQNLREAIDSWQELQEEFEKTCGWFEDISKPARSQDWHHLVEVRAHRGTTPGLSDLRAFAEVRMKVYYYRDKDQQDSEDPRS